jgi:Ca2+-binding EF-hand superfamily protein
MNLEKFFQSKFAEAYMYWNLCCLLIFRGNPENFCDFAFATIDKDKSGKIGFSEFMTTIALTHSGNLNTRLHLVRS